VYARTLDIYAFKAFGKAQLRLQYPGRRGQNLPRLRNVNLILGDNGGGKSSVLRALAIAVLAPALLDSGFVPYRLVRRGRPGERVYDDALLKVMGEPGSDELPAPHEKRRGGLELLARIARRSRGDLDRLHLDSTPSSPISERIYDDFSPAFFVVGYGATRRVETGEFSESSARRSRGPRYQRVAGLFEDHVGLRPLQSWLLQLEVKADPRYQEVLGLLEAVMPANIRFVNARDEEDQYLFEFEGVLTPFSALSDGYKAFIGWVGDLMGHLVDVAPPKLRLAEVAGIVLVDEIDLHLHPAWQRAAVPTLAQAFPKLQFVFTSHSPLVASTVERENVFVTDQAEDGTATIKQLDEKVFGRSAEQLLLSSYFGLKTTRPAAFQDDARDLFQRAAAGDSAAALAYLDSLTATGNQ
jgi:AAA domain, putative AbiEii toxin, Type IV TA system